MTTQDLFRCIGDLSDTMLEEAADIRRKKRWLPIAALAACAVLAISIPLAVRNLGYKSTAAFTTHYAHAQTRKPKKPYKYIMRRELVERREAELPPPRTRGKGRKHHEDCH